MIIKRHTGSPVRVASEEGIRRLKERGASDEFLKAVRRSQPRNDCDACNGTRTGKFCRAHDWHLSS